MNIRQVALTAGVSAATVSRVFSGAAKVDAETRRRVLEAAKKIGYFPNAYARTLSSGRSNTFGLIISDLTNPFFPDLVKAFERKARTFGYETLVVDTDYDLHRMEQGVRRMVEYKVDGVAIMTSEMDGDLVGVLRRRNVPMVFLDTARPGTQVSSIRVRYRHGVELAIAHLHALGHQRIAFIQGPAGLRSATLRREAFLAALKRHNIMPPADYLPMGDHTTGGGQRTMAELLKLRNRPTAVLCSNDLTAIGALHAAQKMGVNVPQELSIMGFDNIQMSDLMRPALTTIDVPRGEIAERAFTALHGMAQGGETSGINHDIECELVVRDSTTAVTPRS